LVCFDASFSYFLLMAQEDSVGFVHSAVERTVTVSKLVHSTMERTIAPPEVVTPNDAGIELEEPNHLAGADIRQKKPMADGADTESEEIIPDDANSGAEESNPLAGADIGQNEPNEASIIQPLQHPVTEVSITSRRSTRLRDKPPAPAPAQVRKVFKTCKRNVKKGETSDAQGVAPQSTGETILSVAHVCI
jgi:hypothetical protein